MEVTFPLLFALIIGFTHAFEADHLLAVSNIVTKRNSLWLAVKDGVAWGLGHTSTIFLIGMIIMVWKVAITEQTFHYFEAFVGIMLIVLGIARLHYLWKNGTSFHTHRNLRNLKFWRKKQADKRPVAPFAQHDLPKGSVRDNLALCSPG